MSNKETTERSLIVQEIMTSMRVSQNRATECVAELESFGLIRFDQEGNFYLKVLED